VGALHLLRDARILILFLVDAVATGGFGLDDRKATAIYGLYTTATYLMALPGGWLADRLLGAQRAVVWGAALILVGNTMLAIPADRALLYRLPRGRARRRPAETEHQRDGCAAVSGRRRRARRRFTLFYLGINVGALIGSLATPWLAQQYGWRAGFAGAAVAMALGFAQFQLTRHHWATLANVHVPRIQRCSPPTSGQWRGVAAVLGAVAVATTLIAAGIVTLDPTQVARWTAVAILVVTVGYFFYCSRWPVSTAPSADACWSCSRSSFLPRCSGRLRAGGLLVEPVRRTVHRSRGWRL